VPDKSFFACHRRGAIRMAPACIGQAFVVRQYGFYSSTNNNGQYKNVMCAAAKRAREPI
jgi:hypothetical protein